MLVKSRNPSFPNFNPLVIGLAATLLMAQTVLAQATREAGKSKQIQVAVETVVADEKLPGMLAAIADEEGVRAIGVAGFRKAGSKAKITPRDTIHIGSCTKAMTCCMLATLVDEGTMNWDLTIIEVFPELRKNIHPDYHNATLWQLVTHRTGMPANAQNWWAYGKMEIKKRRLAILQSNLKAAPTGKSGQYQYSNLGYMVAGCMAERRTGSTWESLMKKRLFAPLKMTSAGFGPPGAVGKTDQPWGHSKALGAWQPRQFDNAPSMGPAGRVHCTLQDWSKFVALQLPQRKYPVLDRRQLDRLIEPTGSYAGGWIVGQRPWAKGTALMHSGSNTLWYATVWVAPKLNRAFFAATNSKDSNSDSICDKMIAKLIQIDQGN